jgi:diamine N-acetyltransferase
LSSGEPVAVDPWRASDLALEAWAAMTGGEDTLARPGDGAEQSVELREITSETVRAICRLAVAPSQMSFVAPNAVSLAEALFEPKAWYRAIYAGDSPVGFAMLSIDTETPTYYLWRFMIAEGWQRRGYGRAAIAAIVDHVRSLPGATELLVSWVPAEGGPEPFYLGLGFVPTGVIHEGEVEARLELPPSG